jgi:hypothetical protein
MNFPRLFQSLAVLTIVIHGAVARGEGSLPAFPGAEGFGALATGGRGGEVIHVTNLEDSGPGSFREAVSHGHRIVVFDVGGYISLKSPVGIASDITVAGQSAPGEGICIRNYEVSLSKSHNVILRYLRFRQGLTHGQEKKYTIGMGECSDVILDHLSVEWGRWDCIGLSKSRNVTIQDCIIGESVDPQRFGCLCQSDNVTFARNLWIDNQSRNPKAKGSVQYVNNVVYNWGVTGYVGGHSAEPHDADLMGNYFIAGPSSNSRFAGEFTATDRIFQSGNLADLDKNGHLDGHPATDAEFPLATIVAERRFHPPVPVREESAEKAYSLVVGGAGDSLHRDAIDRRLMEQVTSLGTKGEIIHDPAQVGGFGELKGGAVPAIPSGDPAKVLPSGYTAIEEYLNALTLPAKH